MFISIFLNVFWLMFMDVYLGMLFLFSTAVFDIHCHDFIGLFSFTTFDAAATQEFLHLVKLPKKSLKMLSGLH